MSLKSAIKLAEMGFYVFPIVENTKIPMVPFKDQATRDISMLEKIWICPLLNIERPYNVGIYTGRFRKGGEDFALTVVDVDNKKGKNGSGTLLDLELRGFNFDDTLIQNTPTGGQHLIYSVKTAVKQGVNLLGDGLDIRSHGGYIVGSGSIIDNIPYTMEGGNVAKCPEWIVSICGPPNIKVVNPEVFEVSDLEYKHAIYYLENDAPESIKNDGGDQTAFAVAAKLKDFGVPVDDALSLMMEYWYGGSGWAPGKLQVKIDNAYNYSKNPLGSATAKFDFKDVMGGEDLKKNGMYLKEINKDHALIFIEGQHFVLYETTDPKGRRKHLFYSEASFKRKLSPFTVQEGRKYLTFADRWLDWKGRREYHGVVFSPEKKCNSTYYNLWKGFTCEPLPYKDGSDKQKRGLDMLLEHIRENVCENQAEYEWLITYFAHMIQKPYVKPLTTVVFKGKKGSGKNAPMERIGQLLGLGHFLVVDDSRYLTSNFNGHLDSLLMLVLDEAFWSGDKKAEGKLKGLTTGREICIERKNKEMYTVDNYLRIIILGNDDWIVPATEDERRYMVLSVNNNRRLDNDFFLEMRLLLEGGGNRLLLHFLKTYNISKVNINTPIKTKGLLAQKLETLSPIHQWWNDCLHEGVLLGSHFSEDLKGIHKKDYVRDAFYGYVKNRSIRTRLPNSIHFGRTLCLFSPKIYSKRSQNSGERSRIYNFPELKILRADWGKFLGQKVTWPEDD